MNEKQIKRIRFWLLRMLNEKTDEITKISKRIGTLSYQAEYFSEMRSETDQQTVLSDLFKDMKNAGWEDSLSELKKEIKDLENE